MKCVTAILLLLALTCNQVHGAARIITGDLAILGQFPWQASVTVTVGTATRFCGGVLVDPSWVVTAAHCTQGATNIQVRLGSLKRTLPATPLLITLPTNLYTHPGYNATSFHNDIALMKLSAPVSLNSSVNTLRIIPPEMYCNNTILRTMLISGWGANSTATNTTLVNDLRYTKVQETTGLNCIAAHGNKVGPTTMCANVPYAPFTTPCTGDDGGPLIIYTPSGTPFLVGIYSFPATTGCGNVSPAGYIHLPPYKDWFNSKGCWV